MKNLSTWLIVMFMVMFWVFRIIVTVMTQYNMDLGGITSQNVQLEIIILFVNLVCFALVAKRKLTGGLIYLLANGMYFGVDIYNNLVPVFSGETIGLNIYMNLFISFVAMILAVAVLLDLLADKGRKANPKDKKTDWFFKNSDYDRKYDDRADRNEYKF